LKKSKKTDTESLGGRLKAYESASELEIDPKDHLIIRIDGHKFSKFTKGLKKPFDDIFSEAMVLTTMDLVEEFQAYTGYTQSDEITLVLPSLMSTAKHKGTNKPQWSHTHSGRVQKLASLVAGFTTMSFNKHLKILVDTEIDDLYRDKPAYETGEEVLYLKNIFHKVGTAWFDARVFGVPSDEEAFNTVMWRVRDAEKNSRSMFAQTYCSHKQLQNKTGPEQVEFCREKTGNDWDLIPDKYKYGVFVKKKQYEKVVDIPLVDEQMKVEKVTRSKIVTFSKDLTNFSDENVKMILAKYLKD